MDRITIFVGVLAVGLTVINTAKSDTVFAPADRPDGDPRREVVERFPESRFGMAPMRVDTGVGAHYAAKAVGDMEASDEADAVPASSSSRSPASLEFDNGHVVRRNHPAPPSRETSEVVYAQASSSETLPAAITRNGVQEVAIIASDLGYFPRTVFVSRDVPVRMFVTSSSKNTLCIMMDSFQVRKQVRSQKIEEITFTPATPGKFRFYCPVNGMEGTLIVKELSTDSHGTGMDRSVARVGHDD